MSLIRSFSGIRPKVKFAKQVTTPNISYLNNFKKNNKLNFLNILYNSKIHKAKKMLKYKDLIKSCDIGLSSVMLRTSLIKKNLFPELKTKEDYVVWLKLTKKKYKALAKAGRDHVLKNYNFENYENQWVKIMDDFTEKNGSWENRKNYKSWHLMEVA